MARARAAERAQDGKDAEAFTCGAAMHPAGAAIPARWGARRGDAAFPTLI